MSDGPIGNLEELLGALAKQRSLRGRLRVIGHSWQLLRALSPVDRERVALRLGSKWAWKRVEKTFLKDGELSENEQLIGQAFERMAGSDPVELRRMARMIREGDSASARDLLMLTLTEALEEEAEEDEAEGGPAAEAPEPKAEAAHDSPEAPEPLVDPEALVHADGVQDVPVPEARLIDRVGDVLASAYDRPVEPAAPSPAPKPTPVAPRAFPERTPPQPAPAPAPTHPSVQPRPAPASPPPRPREAPKPSIRADTTAELPVIHDGTDRFRVLRTLQRSDHPCADLGPAGRAALLESLGGGWASRRALTRMIHTRSLEGLDEALRLIQQLARPAEQTWCLADLIAHWDLGSGEVEQILSAAPTDAARRRLQRRALAP